jgi:hypothetical protein
MIALPTNEGTTWISSSRTPTIVSTDRVLLAILYIGSNASIGINILNTRSKEGFHAIWNFS